MAQHDYIISNGTGAAVRSDLNGVLGATVSNNSGATEPATMYAYQWWPDTTSGLLKQRNSANSAWITIGTLGSANLGLLSLAGGTMTGALAAAAGTVASPGIAFTGDLDTGLSAATANTIVLSTNATARQTISTTAISAALPVDVPLGAAATPSLTFTGDLDSGVFSSGANAVDITTGGTRRFGISSTGDLTAFGGNLTLNAQGDLRFADSDSSNYIAIQAPVTVTSNLTFTLPSVDGTNGQVLSTNGTGTLSFASAGGTILYNRRPALHRGPLFTKTAAATISVTAGAVLNGQYYASATAVTMGTHTNNTDMAIWQHPSTGALVSDASYTTAPAGATGGSIVGGYHYIPSGRPTEFNNGSPTSTAEILEFSIWDLTWRPVCPDPRGMTCVDGRFWCDLYLCGSTSYATTAFTAVPSSKIGLTIADNSSPALIPSFYGGNGSTAYTLVSGNNPGSWYNFAEVAHSFGKRYMHSWEFQAAAFGAPEAGSRGSDPGTVIWERQSKWGLAQATGTLNVWAIERVGIYTSGSNANTGGRGTEYADAPRALLLGGAWDNGADSGSRIANWNYGPSNGYGSFGARFAAEHLVLG